MPNAAPTNLRCEYHTNPLGLGERHPRLSWQLQDERRSARQVAYQIRAASSPQKVADNQPDLWDSGRVNGNQSVFVDYGGPALPSRQRCWWQIRAWTVASAGSTELESPWSEPAFFEMGLLDRADWTGSWIGSPIVGGPRTAVPVPLLRKEFTVTPQVTRARLYITALGLFEARLNGRRIGDDVLAPGWTYYPTRVHYHVYDVAHLLQTGQNVLGVILADGWYAGHTEKLPRQTYGDRPKLLAQLEITFADRSTRIVHTDREWRLWFGPLLEADLIMGESYDARLEIASWDRPNFDDTKWLTAEALPDPGTQIVALRGPAMRHIQELRSSEPKRVGSNWIFDLGQNMVGVVRLKVSGRAGTTIRLRYGEMLNSDGSLYTANLRTARATDYYTCHGRGEESWTPQFTFHGFRYVEVNGFPGTPAADAITGIVIHSDMPTIGEFDCSAPLVNQLQHNIVWGQKGNFLDVPTDCPQRDERLGWMGDAQVFVRTAAFNMDVLGFFSKWLRDIHDAQSPSGRVPCLVPITHPGLVDTDGGPAWADATVICPWTIYQAYGDKRILEEHYDCMVRYVEYLRSTSRDGIRCWDGCDYMQGFGDWLALDGSGETKGGTPLELIGTAFYAHSARLLGSIAAVLGREDDAATYQKVFEHARAAFQRRFLTPAGLIASRTQTSYLLALRFGLLPAELRPAALAELVRDIEKRGMHLATGFIGTPYIAPVLSENGRSDIAHALLNQTTCPSWLYAVTQGATTIWERWDGWTPDKGFNNPGMNSFNHYAFGAVGEWLYESVAGLAIDPKMPGYKGLVIRPQVGGGLTHARASLRTGYGIARAHWQLADGRLRLDVTIPCNTSATVHMPCIALDQATESRAPLRIGDGITDVVHVDGTAVIRVGAGQYSFAAPV